MKPLGLHLSLSSSPADSCSVAAADLRQRDHGEPCVASPLFLNRSGGRGRAALALDTDREETGFYVSWSEVDATAFRYGSWK